MLTLTTERLIVRQATLDDVGAIVDFERRNRVFLAPYEPIRDETYFGESFWRDRVAGAERDYRDGKGLSLHVFHRDDPSRVIGRCGFSSFIRGVFHACYLGYAMDEHAQGKGYMTEALRAGIGHMFEVENFHRIMANYMVSNVASGAVLKKLGFVVEGTARAYLRIAGKWEDHILTALINEGWRDA